MIKKILLVATCLLLLSGCEAKPKRYSAVYTDVFDTMTEFTAYCLSQEEFDNCSEAVHAELLRLHEIFDIYNTYDGLVNAKSLNDSAGERISVPQELTELVTSGVTWENASGGRLNIAFGSVLSLWHDCREQEVLPDEAELKSRAEHCNIGDIDIEGESILLADPKMSLDFGALAKGYAAQKASEIAADRGVENFALSVGGNIVTHGQKPEGKWEIGVENPDGGILTTVKVADAAVVTSGDYQRFFELDDVRYHHIIDTETLYPASLWRSVTVICDYSDVADALSTALFCMPLEDGLALLENYPAEAMWVSPDGSVTRSEGFASYEK